MYLRSLQRLVQDSSGRFAPFMFGLLLAVSAFSMTMKSRVETQLSAQKQEQIVRAQKTADDLSQAMEVSMLLETAYSSTFDLNRARQYLAQSTGLTAGSANPVFDAQTGLTATDGYTYLSRQTALISTTDDALLRADNFAARQGQLAISKLNLDAFSAEVMEFVRGNHRVPTTTELATISSTTGLRTYWNAAFTNAVSHIFYQSSSFIAPWSGLASFANHIILPFTSTGPTYTWASAPEVTFTINDGFENYVVAGPGVIAVGVATGASTTYTYIFEYQSGAWVERQRIPGSGLSGFGLAIEDNLMTVGNPMVGHLDIYQRTGGTWQFMQRLTGFSTFNDTKASMKKYQNTTHLYVTDGTTVRYYLSTTEPVNFSLIGTLTFSPASNCPYAHIVAVDMPGQISVVPSQPIAVVGCAGYSSNRGRAYVFQGTSLIQTLAPTTLDANDSFGYSISFKWPYLVVSARQDEISGANNNGAVYVYQDLDITGSRARFSLMSHFQEPTATNGTTCGTSQMFGSTTAFIDERSFAVTAGCTNGAGTGNDSSVFIYTLTNNGWTRTRSLHKAGVTGSNGFGESMSGADGVLAIVRRLNTAPMTVFTYKAPEL